jgi:hypothetical protein
MNDSEIQSVADELRDEYDLTKLKSKVRGKYVDRYQSSTNLVLLEDDVRDAFPDAESVNDALRMLMKVADRSVSKQP